MPGYLQLIFAYVCLGGWLATAFFWLGMRWIKRNDALVGTTLGAVLLFETMFGGIGLWWGVLSFDTERVSRELLRHDESQLSSLRDDLAVVHAQSDRLAEGLERASASSRYLTQKLDATRYALAEREWQLRETRQLLAEYQPDWDGSCIKADTHGVRGRVLGHVKSTGETYKIVGKALFAYEGSWGNMPTGVPWIDTRIDQKGDFYIQAQPGTYTLFSCDERVGEITIKAWDWRYAELYVERTQSLRDMP